MCRLFGSLMFFLFLFFCLITYHGHLSRPIAAAPRQVARRNLAQGSLGCCGGRHGRTVDGPGDWRRPASARTQQTHLGLRGSAPVSPVPALGPAPGTCRPAPSRGLHSRSPRNGEARARARVPRRCLQFGALQIQR